MGFLDKVSDFLAGRPDQLNTQSFADLIGNLDGQTSYEESRRLGNFIKFDYGESQTEFSFVENFNDHKIYFAYRFPQNVLCGEPTKESLPCLDAQLYHTRKEIPDVPGQVIIEIDTWNHKTWLYSAKVYGDTSGNFFDFKKFYELAVAAVTSGSAGVLNEFMRSPWVQ